MPSTPVIQLEHVTKRYGRIRGIEDLSLVIQPGTIFGFLGPNGAGKTTTISMLVDLIRPTSGTIKIFGLDSRREGTAIRRRMGFLAGDFALDKNLTGWQQLEYFGNLHGDFKRQRVQQLAERLDCDLTRKFYALSRGNRQKVGLISALMHDPELLVFDEPTSGLDPLIQAEFNKLVLEYQQQGKTIFISSHALSEVQAVCEQVGFIREGRLIAVKGLHELTAASTKHVRVVASDKQLFDKLVHMPHIHLEMQEANTIALTTSGDINPVLAILAQHKVQDITITEADLETIFMQYYQEDSDV
jgi:ABC-2 type transport system ATP-binding protein